MSPQNFYPYKNHANFAMKLLINDVIYILQKILFIAGYPISIEKTNKKYIIQNIFQKLN